MKQTLIIFISACIAFSSCVTARQFDELSNEKDAINAKNDELARANQDLTIENEELNAEIRNINERMAALESDTTILGTSLRHMRNQYDKINDLNELLSSKSSELLSEAADENRKILDELNEKELKLQKTEDDLMSLEVELNKKESALDSLETDLADRSKRLEELESLLSEQEQVANALKSKVTDALKGFEHEGLSIVEKDGKVYVSLEANLLFPSGSTKINDEGKDALISLAKAIQDNEDLEVIVEGHTDTDAIKSNSIPSDNWELSVLRATAVVKLMTENSSIHPDILTASGRSEFHPVDESNKAKNRRIEIILSPDLTELYNIID